MGLPIKVNRRKAKKILELFHNHRLQLLVYVTLYYGLRRSEALGLKSSAVDLKQGKIIINYTIVKSLTIVAKDRTKSETSNRNYKLCPKLIELFKKHKEQQEKKIFWKKVRKKRLYIYMGGRKSIPSGLCNQSIPKGIKRKRI